MWRSVPETAVDASTLVKMSVIESSAIVGARMLKPLATLHALAGRDPERRGFQLALRGCDSDAGPAHVASNQSWAAHHAAQKAWGGEAGDRNRSTCDLDIPFPAFSVPGYGLI